MFSTKLRFQLEKEKDKIEMDGKGGKEHLVGWRRECKEKKTETIINERYTKKDDCDTASNNFYGSCGESLSHI